MKYHGFKAFTAVFKNAVFRVRITLLRCFILLFSIAGLSTFSAHSQIMVGLMENKGTTRVMISPFEGNYVLINSKHDTLYTFRSDDAVSITVYKNQVIAKSVYGLNDTLRSVTIAGSGLNPRFRMRIGSSKEEHEYFETIKLSTHDAHLRMVNTAGIDRYVSMVVQAEVGYGATEEYYKIQSIICRTYAMRNLGRHIVDRFDVCDNEHCQVYSGLKQPTNEVVKATASTSGSVMVDEKNNLILSAFHANCGGQTANSEDVWRESRSYLRSVKDTFCLGSRSATWIKAIPFTELLSQVGFSFEGTNYEGMKFYQPDRKKFFKLGTDSIETSKMRGRLRLRSTYFNLDIENGEAHLHGRGYGHGVGLCQQGAMKMAQSGYTYSQILGYYYKDVGLVPISSLQVEK
jgi:stage II sporulation protein D